MTSLPRIGFVGLGNMGGPMCQRLVGAGYPVSAFDLNPDALERVVAVGAVAATSAAACAAQADIFLTSLPRPDHVEAVMAGDNGALAHLKSGSLWVDLTTNRNELVFRLASQAPQGVAVVDSPVTGAVDGARNGKLTLFAGGDQVSFDRAAEVLGHLGLVIHCGALGTGNVVKLVTNQLWFIGAAAIGEGFATGMANGVELGTLWHAIRSSVGDSFVAQHDAPSIFAGHYDPSFSLDLCLKDLRLIQELNRNVRAALPMTTAAEGAFALAASRYGAQAAELHVARRIEDDAGISMRLEGDWVPPWEQ
ncbi:NAD(P)-dependent oxidoreductase [Aminobacter aganoensis]|uniref:3-hydroxyisobutyrate dehydrogenase/2-hydroxy-3-oxopropionate reductase n=1 Tax=Aminobacter aganoensis TaxID=83264 RepID=A0A7X0F7H8_9HYPH|nr:MULTISPECIES: NAD(P)-dependent oxidoreductase [Aminobacter]MBB6354577.1 3-hydroxyisobutyrate dehydrogenase/2-hydroxy-3-oxopropionate reductase [Aminobacter aganoensis]